MIKKPIYIVDYELVSPVALGKNEVMPNILSNKDACGKIENFDVAGLPFQDGAEVKENLDYLIAEESDQVKAVCKIDRKLELIAATYGLAKHRLKDFIPLLNPDKTGVILGVGAETIPLELFESEVRGFLDKKLNAVVELISKLNTSGHSIHKLSNPHDLYALYLADKFNARAFQSSILTACVSSTQAIAHACDNINAGKAEVVIAGGTDSILNLISLISFGKLGVIPESDGEIACLPFDVNRRGTSSGEAAGIMILANEDFVKKNNLKPVASIVGYGNTLDGYKITAPDPEGTSMVAAINKAIETAGIKHADIDYYYAHGTGTRQNDGTELNAMQAAFGEDANAIPISSTKDRHGHAIAAAGIQEMCLLLEFMKAGIIPANMNLKTPIKEDLNLLQKNINKPIKYALKSNFAFGGINTVLAVKNESL